MAANTFLNLTESNFAAECICGQANNGGLAQVQVANDGPGARMFTKPVAIEKGNVVALKNDGKFYLATAAVSGQLRAVGLAFNEYCNGQAMDVITQSRTIELPTAPASAAPGGLAYLGETPGTIVAIAPVGTGKLVQVVGLFHTTRIVKTNFADKGTVLP